MVGGLIVNSGKKMILDRSYNSVPSFSTVSKYKVGIGTAAANVLNTDLEFAVPLQNFTVLEDGASTAWTAVTGTTLTASTAYYKSSPSSISILKVGTASTSVALTKIVPALDFSNQFLSLWIFIADSTMLGLLQDVSSLVIKYGSDASNYYFWSKNKTVLSVGWNLLDNLTSANGSVVGTAVLTAMTYVNLNFGATATTATWGINALNLDDIKVYNTANTFSSFDAGYPNVDFNSLTVVSRFTLNTLQGNGYDITECGCFNSDGSVLMESRDVFNGVSKTSNDQIIFQVKTTIN